MFKPYNFLIGCVVVLLPHILTAQKLNLKLVEKTELGQSDYFSESQPVQKINDHILYSVKLGKVVSFYKVGEVSDSLVFSFETRQQEYYKSFRFTQDLSSLFLLLHESVLKFDLQSTDRETPSNSSSASSQYLLTEPYEDLVLDRNKVILTNAYNEAVDPTAEAMCRFLILDTTNLKEITKQNIAHDALGLTHKRTYLFAVHQGKILFVNSLHNSFYIFDTEKLTYSNFGDSSLLNPKVDKIPFETKILKYTNPKDVVLRTIKFAGSVNYYEGGMFLNDSTIMISQKVKGHNQSKRKLHFYRYNKQNNQWEILGYRTFKNGKISDQYHIFQFYYSNPLQVDNNRIYLTEISISNLSKRKIDQEFEDSEKIKFALYEYQLEF